MIKLNTKKGFTLLEALVAISILMVAVVAPITIAQKGLSSAVYSKNQMIASYLAQDAIEYIKNRRDNITLNDVDNDWRDFDEFSVCFNRNCEIDTINKNVSNSNNNKLKKDSNNFYQYVSGEDTNFIRNIRMDFKDITANDKISNENDEILITVTVHWGVGDEQVVVKTLIYNY